MKFYWQRKKRSLTVTSFPMIRHLKRTRERGIKKKEIHGIYRVLQRLSLIKGERRTVMTNVRKMIITSMMKMMWHINEFINEFNAQNPTWFELLILIISTRV